MADLRRRRLILVSHSLLSDLPGSPAIPVAQRRTILAWADGLEAGIYQFPPPGHQLVPGVDPRGRRALSNADAEDLSFVFGQLASYLADGYRVLGTLTGTHDLRGRAGQGWWRRCGTPLLTTGFRWGTSGSSGRMGHPRRPRQHEPRSPRCELHL